MDTTNINERQRLAFEKWLTHYSSDKINDLVVYVAKLQEHPECTHELAERLVLKKLKDDMGAAYNPDIYSDVPQALLEIK